MSKVTIDQLRSLPDFAQVTKWDLTFITLPVLGPLGFPLSEQLNVRCESIEVPKTTNQKFDVMVRGHKVVNSGILDYGNTMTVTFVETVDNTIFNFVKAWREACWASRTGRALSKKDLEATIMITLLDNQDNARAKYTVYGAFLESADFGTLDGSTSDAQKPSITLAYDFYVDSPLKV